MAVTRRTVALALLVTSLLVALGGAWSGASGQVGDIAAGRAPAGGRVIAPLAGDAPSPVIYPPGASALRMDHAHPAHRALRCVSCHRGAGVSERVEDDLLPREERCLPCHLDRIDRGEPSTEERCGFCHVGFGALDHRVVPASELPAARLQFSHRTHVDDGMRCLDCHAGVERAGPAEGRHLPRMRECFECHAPPGLGLEARAPSACPTCHLARPDGRLRVRFPEGPLNPPAWLFDMRHDHEWSVRHRWVAADQGAWCAQCHQESDCVDCHDGRVRPARIHPGDYLTTHVAQARRDQPRCSSCHEPTRFCAECHSRLGLSPLAAPAVRAASRYHPPSALWVRGPVLHATEARRAMNTCATCHAERDCVACHGASGTGAGVSPHPPGFAATCASDLARNARACAQCHGDLAPVRERCR